MIINFHLIQYCLLEHADLICNWALKSIYFMMISIDPDKILRI